MSLHVLQVCSAGNVNIPKLWHALTGAIGSKFKWLVCNEKFLEKKNIDSFTNYYFYLKHLFSIYFYSAFKLPCYEFPNYSILKAGLKNTI